VSTRKKNAARNEPVLQPKAGWSLTGLKNDLGRCAEPLCVKKLPKLDCSFPRMMGFFSHGRKSSESDSRHWVPVSRITSGRT
jgi:hypothetical protein